MGGGVAVQFGGSPAERVQLPVSRSDGSSAALVNREGAMFIDKFRRSRLPVAAVAVASAAMLVLAACGGSSSGGSSGAGTPSGSGETLTVGSSADFPPMSFKKEGSSDVIGFE